MVLAIPLLWYRVIMATEEVAKLPQLLVCLGMVCHHPRHQVFRTYFHKEEGMRSLLTTSLSSNPQTLALIRNGDSLVKVSNLLKQFWLMSC